MTSETENTLEQNKKAEVQRKKNNNYSKKYRILKTLLMMFAWISLGICIEIPKVSLEDLKILLNTNYQSISFGLVMTSIGFTVNSLFIGIITDRLIKYSESIMVIGKLLIVIPVYLLPWTRTYWISMLLFLIQGIGFGIVDTGGNQIMFRLWNDISTSPLNAMHAGYGVGAMLSVQIVKNYIKYNPFINALSDTRTRNGTNFNSSKFNDSNKGDVVRSSDIALHVPYAISGTIGLVICICFIIAQYFELKNIKKLNKPKEPLIGINENTDVDNKEVVVASNIPVPKVQKILFTDRSYRPKSFIIVLIELFLMNFLLFNIASVLAVSSMLMITYLSKGPARLPLKTCFILQTLYWIAFIAGRIISVFLAFKLNPLLYMFCLLLSAVCFTGLYAIPHLNTIQLSYWFIISALGLVCGPLVPTIFMSTKHILVSINTVIVAIFCIGTGMGRIVSQYVAGRILDTFVPSEGWLGYKNPTSTYTIPLMLFVYMSFCLAIFTVLIIIYKKFNKNL